MKLDSSSDSAAALHCLTDDKVAQSAAAATTTSTPPSFYCSKPSSRIGLSKYLSLLLSSSSSLSPRDCSSYAASCHVPLLKGVGRRGSNSYLCRGPYKKGG
eukprot:766945-Hanusia_phi.AAC.2